MKTYTYEIKNTFCGHLETSSQKDSNNNISKKENLRMWDILLIKFSKTPETYHTSSAFKDIK